MADINRTTNSMALPSDISSEILQKTKEESAIMRLAHHIALPGRGVTIPVITNDPSAAWVAETYAKPVSNATPATKLMSAYKIAVIETFSKEFVRDIPALYDALVDRLPGALAGVFDSTVIGATLAPGDNFDTFANCTKVSILNANNGTYLGIVAADANIAAQGGVMSGIALGAQGRGLLLTAVDGQGRPLFMASANEGVVDRVLGVPCVFNSKIFKAGTAGTDGTPATVGVAGDWSKAFFGTVNGVEISVSDTATLTVGSGTSATQLNLWQQNMVAVRAEIEVGFRADKDCFNLLTGAVPTE
ncbi:MAG: phage major capsid protein [Oscillospiraceae bacterium]|nr:phage major capsid protein [Oscillospiraceae bacterium]